MDIYVGANMASSVEWYINWKTASEILFVAMNTVRKRNSKQPTQHKTSSKWRPFVSSSVSEITSNDLENETVQLKNEMPYLVTLQVFRYWPVFVDVLRSI